MPENAILVVIGLPIAIVIAFIYNRFKTWYQTKSEQIRVISRTEIHVDYPAIKSDKKGYYIPKYGRLANRSDVRNPNISFFDLHEVNEKNDDDVLICRKIKLKDKTEPYFIVKRIVPVGRAVGMTGNPEWSTKPPKFSQ